MIPGNEKRQLLSEIMPLLEASYYNGTTDAPLKEKMQRYNIICDREDESKSNLGHDPLHVLPFEVWEEVIHECVVTYSDLPSDWNLDKLLELTRVSVKWRAAIIQTPSFWRNISIDTLMEDLEAKVALCLSLSRGGLLKIGLEIPVTSCWETLGPIIGAQSSRVLSILLYTRIGFAYRYFDRQSVINTALEYFGELLSLQDVTSYIRGSFNVDPVLRRARAISSIRGIDTSPQTLGIQSLIGLRYLWISDSFINLFENIYPYLPTLPHLKEVVFFNDLLYMGQYENIKQLPPPEQSLVWTHFTYIQRPIFLFDKLYDHLSSTIQYLSININWGGLYRLINACSEMHRLHTLSLEIIYSSDPITDLLIESPSHIRELKLCLTTHGNPDGLGARAPDEGYGNNVKCLFKALITWAPSIEILGIVKYDTLEETFSYFKSLQRLKNPEYCSNREDYLPDESVILPTVEDVTFRVANPSFISRIQSPQALSVTYDPVWSVLEYPQVETWTNLLTLTFRGLDMTWKGISLPRVKRVTLIPDTGSPFNAHNSLCGELAMRPTMFPFLEYLQMGYFPQWDVLFTMLERRNFSMIDGVSPISIITFYPCPPPQLHRALVYRLGGRMSERPSNYNLSMLSHLDIYFDPKILGCDMCHKGFLPCNFIVQSKSLWKQKIPEPLPYPLTTGGLLASRDDLSRWFDQYSATLRETACERYDMTKVQEISGCIEAGLFESTFQYF